ncbi:hypothetical protein [Streptacidiphilus cavernicola]|uniref:Uncharacterized protein n=1 Tax=Streptacidiphilus cavernicola TaxID=3342716 RepID=A0ABV6VZV9_9ACTN
MYYSNGNYEAFARPRKPAGADRKTAWFVGAGLASLAGAAYRLLGVERGVPEVHASTYDLRALLAAASRLRDGAELSLPGPEFLRRRVLHRLEETQIGALLAEYDLLKEEEPDRP